MAWVTPALIVAGIAAGAAGLAHDIQGFVAGKTPWENPGEWVTGALKAGAIGFGTGFATGAAGAALGPAVGGGAGATGGVGGGAAGAGGAGGAGAGAVGGFTAAEGASGLGDALAMIGEGTGTTAAEAGAATPATVAGVLPQEAGSILSQGTQGPLSLIQESLGKAAINAGSGALQDTRNPLRGALSGAAGSIAGSGMNYVGQSTGMIPSTAPNYQPMGGAGGYSNASVMPPAPAYVPPTQMPMGSQMAAAAGRMAPGIVSRGASMGVNQMMTPAPPQPVQPTYANYVPYYERAPYA